MKKKFVIFLVIIFLFSLNVFSAKKILKLPLRAFDKSGSNKFINKGDISFKINGKVEDEFEFVYRERALNKDGLPLKYYILDFNLFDYYNGIGEAIDYFIDNIVKDEPIILLTRSKIYRFYNYNSKSYLKTTIRKLVREDTIKFKAETKAYYKKFRAILSRLSSLSKESCQKFINDYLREWTAYKMRFVYPDMRKYQMLSNLLSDKDGDKFIISFQHREVIPYYNDVQKALAKMNDFISSAVSGEDQAWATMVSGGINDINQSLLLSKGFPKKIFNAVLMNNNISFNVILLNNRMTQRGGGGYNDVSPDLEKLLRDISHNSGGVSITSDNLREAIDKIKSHKDTYYCIKFKVKKPKDFKFEITPLNEKIRLIYPPLYSKGFVKSLFKIEKNKVKVSKVSVSAGRIGFSISNFKMVKKQGKITGALKVKIFVVDKKGSIVYKTGNILNVVKKTINIKLPPVSFNGNYKLYIVVRDLIGESSRIFEKEFKF